MILVEGRRTAVSDLASAEEGRVLGILAAELPLKQAAELAARITGGKKNRLYQLALEQRASGDADTSGPMVK